MLPLKSIIPTIFKCFFYKIFSSRIVGMLALWLHFDFTLIYELWYFKIWDFSANDCHFSFFFKSKTSKSTQFYSFHWRHYFSQLCFLRKVIKLTSYLILLSKKMHCMLCIQGFHLNVNPNKHGWKRDNFGVLNELVFV